MQRAGRLYVHLFRAVKFTVMTVVQKQKVKKQEENTGCNVTWGSEDKCLWLLSGSSAVATDYQKLHLRGWIAKELGPGCSHNSHGCLVRHPLFQAFPRFPMIVCSLTSSITILAIKKKKRNSTSTVYKHLPWIQTTQLHFKRGVRLLPMWRLPFYHTIQGANHLPHFAVFTCVLCPYLLMEKWEKVMLSGSWTSPLSNDTKMVLISWTAFVLVPNEEEPS